ncbi:MAG TPA: DUF1275 domain-containing protein [Clostridiales bacterium]|nr:DUF1275 domain-containing protein [Clostridiales bacterium]
MATTFKQYSLPHEALRIGLLLAFVGGYLDAYTYLLRGQVFANAQTGNIVLMGISVAQGHWDKVSFYVIPIVTFFLGILLTEYIKNKCDKSQLLNWEHMIFPIEIILLFGVGLYPVTAPNSIVNVVVSFVCAVQVQSFRVVHNTPYASTMCTGNLRSAAENLFKLYKTKERVFLHKFLMYIFIIASFILGAGCGTFLSGIFFEKSIWVCCGVLLIAFLIIIIRNRHIDNIEQEL